MAEARLHAFYNKEIAPKLKEEFSYSNVMEIPKLKKSLLMLELVKQFKTKKH